MPKNKQATAFDPAHRFSHFRMRDRKGAIDNRSGATVAYAVHDGRLFCAAAYCGPRDNFSYATGRIKSSARLRNLLNNPQKEDGNIYFTKPVVNDDVASAVRAVRDFMVAGLGYAPRYEPQTETVAA